MQLLVPKSWGPGHPVWAVLWGCSCASPIVQPGILNPILIFIFKLVAKSPGWGRALFRRRGQGAGGADAWA